jgi:hypothetical protein
MQTLKSRKMTGRKMAPEARGFHFSVRHLSAVGESPAKAVFIFPSGIFLLSASPPQRRFSFFCPAFFC